MKWMIAIALLAAAGFLPAKSASGKQPRAHYMTIQSSVPPVPVMEVCYVNGVSYPVDYAYRIWGTTPSGAWLIIGVLRITPTGPIAVSGGMFYPASC